MDQAEVQALFRRFSSPLAGYVSTSPERKGLAEMLVRNLWMALIAGPEMEEETWRILKTTGKLNDDSLKVIQETYYDQMKPVVGEEKRAELRGRYSLRRKSKE